MELARYAAVVRRWWWLLFLSTGLAAAVAYLTTPDLGPEYRATTTLLVTGDRLPGEYVMAQDLDLLVQNYAQIIMQRTILERATEAAEVALTPEELARKTTVKRIMRTTLFTVAVSAPKPEQAAVMANEMAGALVNKINEISKDRTSSSQQELGAHIRSLEQEMAGVQERINSLRRDTSTAGQAGRDSQIATLTGELSQSRATYEALRKAYDDLLMVQATTASAVVVVDPANVPTRPANDYGRLLTSALLGIAGLGLALGVAFLLDYLDDRLRSLDEVESRFGLYLLGTVSGPGALGGVVGAGDSSAHGLKETADGYRLLQSGLAFRMSKQSTISLVGTSVSPDVDAGNVLANLGAALAEAGRRVLLVDANLRSPSLHSLFKVSHGEGFGEWSAQRDGGLETYVNPITASLHVLSPGSEPRGSSPHMTLPHLKRLLDEATKRYDVVLVNTPPLLEAADAAALSTAVDGVILVIHAGHTSRGTLRKAQRTLERVGAIVAGVVAVTIKKPRRATTANAPIEQGYSPIPANWGYPLESGTGLTGADTRSVSKAVMAEDSEEA